MKVVIVSILFCFALSVSARNEGRRPHPPHRKGPVTAQELSHLISSGLKHLDEVLRKREPIPLPKLDSTSVQSDSINVTLDLIRGKQIVGRTILQTISVKKTNSSLKLSLEVELEGNRIDATAAIKGTINGTEVDLTAPIVIRTEESTIKASLEADLGRKSVNVTDLEYETSVSRSNVTLSGLELAENVVESMQEAVADNIAETIEKMQKIIEENKEGAIAVWNKEIAGKSLEEIVDSIVKDHHRGHHGRIQKHFQQLLSL